jgi:hypothetical protein
MRHLVITRISFEDDQLFSHYFEVMKQTYIPSIKSQTNKNFQIAFIINPRHVEMVNQYFESDVLYFNSFDQIKTYCKENNIEIQTRHDCDDYIEKIQELFNNNIQKFDKFIIHSKVQKLNYDTGEIHDHATSYLNNNFISMFLTLCQKNAEHFVYDKNHRFMGELTNNIILIDGGYTRLVIHGKNKLSKINPKDVKLSETKSYDLTLIVPTFDNVEYLQDFINSIKNSKKHYEIEVLIGIDNCEKTKIYVQSKINTFPSYIKFYFFNENLGPYIIRNSLSKVSNADKLLFVDSDDILHQNIIEQTLQGLQKFEIIRYKFYNFTTPSEIKENKIENINSFHSIGQLGIYKSLFEKNNGFEPWVCGADSEFKMREEGNKLLTLKTNNVLYYRRRHDKNLTIKPETNQKSRVRQQYNFEIQNRRRLQKFIKDSEMTVTKFYQIKDKTNMDLVYDFSNTHIDKNLEEKSDQDTKIQKSIATSNHNLELTNKTVDYQKINQIFEKSVNLRHVIRTNVNSNQTSLKKNTDMLQTMMGKNKRKFL